MFNKTTLVFLALTFPACVLAQLGVACNGGVCVPRYGIIAVDLNYGSDAHNGFCTAGELNSLAAGNTSADSACAMQHVSTLTTNGVPALSGIGLAAGSHWREELDVPVLGASGTGPSVNTTVAAIGLLSNGKPILDASDILSTGSGTGTNIWTLAGTQTYSTPVTFVTTVNASSSYSNVLDLFGGTEKFLASGLSLNDCDTNTAYATTGCTAVSVGNIQKVSLGAGGGGTGYSVNDNIHPVQSGCTGTVSVSAVDGVTGAITAYQQFQANQTGCQVASNLATTGGTGTGATMNILQVGAIAGTSVTLYVRAGNGSNPYSNSHSYEFTNRQFGLDSVVGGASSTACGGFSVWNIVTKNQFANNGSTQLANCSLAVNDEWHNGSKHLALIQGGSTVINGLFEDFNYSLDGTSAFIAYNNTGTGRGYNVLNTTWNLTPTTILSGASGLATDTHVAVGSQGDFHYTNVNCTGSWGGCFTSGQASGKLFLTNATVGAGVNQAVFNYFDATINNLTSSANTGIEVETTGGSPTITLTNSTLNIPAGGFGIFSSGGTPTYTSSNVEYLGTATSTALQMNNGSLLNNTGNTYCADFAYVAGGSATITGNDHNAFYGPSQTFPAEIGGTNRSTATWQTMYGQDQNSTFTGTCP